MLRDREVFGLEAQRFPARPPHHPSFGLLANAASKTASSGSRYNQSPRPLRDNQTCHSSLTLHRTTPRKLLPIMDFRQEARKWRKPGAVLLMFAEGQEKKRKDLTD